MSINPVSETGPSLETIAVPAAAHADPPSGAQPQSAPETPNVGAEPKQEMPPGKRQQQSAELPQDVVRVQRDDTANGQIVIRYLDASGNLILQIPSSQVLGLARAIDQALEEQAKSHKIESDHVQLGKGGKS